VALSLSAALLVLFYAIVAVLVVNFSLGIVAEDFVGFGDFYELLVRGIISTDYVSFYGDWLKWWDGIGRFSTYGFLSG
jgi:hypothetical protein